MSKIQFPALTQDFSLIKYLEDIKKFPILTENEEVELALSWCRDGDVKAAQKLVTSHLRLVAKIAMQYRGYGLSMADIISEGNIGLMTAVKKFDPALGHRLATYAMWWIKSNIHDYILKSWSLIKMSTSATQKKLFFNLKKVKNKLLHLNKGQIPVNEIDLISKELEISKKNVIEMNDRFCNREISLNNYSYEDSDEEIIDSIAETSDNQEVSLIKRNDYNYKKKKFINALKVLNKRERSIFCSRRLLDKPIKLEELSKEYGVSGERIRQIEDRAFKKIKAAVLAETEST
jgi:RNA polymerase sigma-32 factor